MIRIGFHKNGKWALRPAPIIGRRTPVRVVTDALARIKRRARSQVHLVIVPPELRAADPSFWREISSGHFGLSGAVAELGGGSPFDAAPPCDAWARELHGFAWLRHLEVADDANAQAAARRYIEEWATSSRRDKVCNLAGVRARRIHSWLAHAPFVLGGADEDLYDLFGAALKADVAALAVQRLKDADGLTRLQVATALAIANLAIEGADRNLPRILERLDAEIERQILPDGGHISRNPVVIFELLLDWMPLKSCLEGRGLEPTTAFLSALHRMLAMLRFMRLGDGSIARFNGMGAGDPVAVATLLAYDDEPAPVCAVSRPSGYVRLSCGPLVLIADGGAPPPPAASTGAHAGCLSFEVSAKSQILVCNGGAPGSSSSRWGAVARATASHSTVCAGESSSAVLVRNPRLEATFGSAPLAGPERVSASAKMSEDGSIWIGSHDGYVGRFHLEHHREVRLRADGALLSGTDRLQTPRALDRLKRDVPFAIHFHLHPDSSCTPVTANEMGLVDGLLITLRDGQRWVFNAPGFWTGIEESLSFSSTSGPRPALQIVVRGATVGLTEVSWSFMQLVPAPTAAAPIKD